MTDAQFLLSILEDGLPHSHADLLHRSSTERGCGLTVHSRIADLRAKGHTIACDRVPGAERGHAWTYRLLGSLPESDQSLGGSSTGHAHEHEGRSDSESESLFEITDYGMGGKPAWA